MNVFMVLRRHVLDGYDNLPLGRLRHACHAALRERKEHAAAMKPTLNTARHSPPPSLSLSYLHEPYRRRLVVLRM